MIIFRLFFEFAKIGLFSFGGGMATIPFLQDLSVKTGWFTIQQLTDFIRISESTPGPMAINVATYAGFETAGVLGSVAATFGVMFPALILITIMAKFLDKFKGNKYLDWAFYGLRPCVLALIGFAFTSIVKVTMFYSGVSFSNMFSMINWKAVLIFAVIFALINVKKLKKLHPVMFLALSAVMGMVLYSF